MPVLQPDFSEALEFGPVEPGTYPAKMISFEIGTSQKGNAKLVGKMELTVDGKIRPRTVHWPINGAGAGSLKQYLRAIGREDLTVPGAPLNTDEIINIEFHVVMDRQRDNPNYDEVKACLKI